MIKEEERLRVLKMVQEGKITAEQAVELLDALSEGVPLAGKDSKTSSSANSFYGKGGSRWLRVRVTDTDSGKTRVNIRLPISVVTAGLKMGMRFAPEVEGLDSGQLIEAIKSGELGQILDVFDDKDGEHVEVFIE